MPGKRRRLVGRPKGAAGCGRGGLRPSWYLTPSLPARACPPRWVAGASRRDSLTRLTAFGIKATDGRRRCGSAVTASVRDPWNNSPARFVERCRRGGPVSEGRPSPWRTDPRAGGCIWRVAHRPYVGQSAKRVLRPSGPPLFRPPVTRPCRTASPDGAPVSRVHCGGGAAAPGIRPAARSRHSTRMRPAPQRRRPAGSVQSAGRQQGEKREGGRRWGIVFEGRRSS